MTHATVARGGNFQKRREVETPCAACAVRQKKDVAILQLSLFFDVFWKIQMTLLRKLRLHEGEPPQKGKKVLLQKPRQAQNEG